MKDPRSCARTAARKSRAAVFVGVCFIACSSERPVPPPDLPAVGGQVSLLRFPAGGGPVQAYHPDSLTESEWASHPVPPIRRALGANLDERLVWAIDAEDRLVGIDLETRVVRRRLAGVRVGSVGPDGSLYLVDTSQRIVRLARRDEVRFPDPLPALPRALYPAVNDQVIAITRSPARLITASADQQVHSAPIPGGEVSATSWGDLVAIASDSGVTLHETGGEHVQRSLPVRPARRVIFSPSGHRLFVSQPREPLLRVFDRFQLRELDPLRLPGVPREFRVDASGRWLLAHREAGDSNVVGDDPAQTDQGEVEEKQQTLEEFRMSFQHARSVPRTASPASTSGGMHTQAPDHRRREPPMIMP